jgi:hypothetical protein
MQVIVYIFKPLNICRKGDKSKKKSVKKIIEIIDLQIRFFNSNKYIIL